MDLSGIKSALSDQREAMLARLAVLVEHESCSSDIITDLAGGKVRLDRLARSLQTELKSLGVRPN
jgi:hypothetical protein